MKLMSDKRLLKIAKCYNDFGLEATLKEFNIQESSLSRYLSEYRRLYGEMNPSEIKLPEKEKEEEKEELILSKSLKAISEKYTPKELEAIAKGASLTSLELPKNKINFVGETVKIGIVSDTHMGSIYFRQDWWESCLDEFEKEKVNLVVHTGDLTDGMAQHHPGSLYELVHIGFDAQKAYAIEMMSKCQFPTYIISGNHDDWYQAANGALIVKDVSDAVEQLTYLGDHEGDLVINNVVIKLWHGQDSGSYARSYRIEKLVEAITGGPSKPNAIFAGHTHKSIYLPAIRNIHCIGSGAVCMQSKWMRTKRLSNDSGFWIAEVTFDENGITCFSAKFYNFYV